jgi:hypothetical protein
MSSKKVFRTPKEFWDDFDPKWREVKKLIDKFPNTFRLRYSEQNGYFWEIHITSLEGHLPVEAD